MEWRMLFIVSISNDQRIILYLNICFSYLIAVQRLSILVYPLTRSSIIYLLIQTLMLWSILWMEENKLEKLKDAKFPIFIWDQNTPSTYRVKSFSLPDQYILLWNSFYLHCSALYNMILRIARNFLEIRENIKILTI